MATPMRRFARISFSRFDRLCAEIAAFTGADVYQGEVIAERASGDRRATAFCGWSSGKSARDCRNRMQFAMRKQAAKRGREIPQTRIIFIEEPEFLALCAKPSVREELLRLEIAQGPVTRDKQGAPHQKERQELLRLVTDVQEIERRVRVYTAQQPLRLLQQETPVEEEGEGGVCACLNRAYVLVRKVGLLEGDPLVPQPDYREIRASVVAQMEKEAQGLPRRHHGRRIWRAPKEQLGLWKEAKG